MDGETRQRHPTLRTWKRHHFAKFRRHMTLWSKTHPPSIPSLNRYTEIVQAMANFVEVVALELQPKPNPFAADLYERMKSNPQSERDRAAWVDYIAMQKENKIQKGLRRFRSAAIKGHSLFFQTMAPWLLNPQESYNTLP